MGNPDLHSSLAGTKAACNLGPSRTALAGAEVNSGSGTYYYIDIGT